jgi:hypothetical protein
MEVAASFEALVPVYQTAWCHIREDRGSDIQRQENLQSQIISFLYWVWIKEVALCSLVGYNVSDDVAASIYPEDGGRKFRLNACTYLQNVRLWIRKSTNFSRKTLCHDLCK